MNKFVKAGVAALTVLSSGVAAQAEEARLKVASAYPLSLVQLGSLAKNLETNLNTISGGDVQVKMYEPNALVPSLEIFDAVANGSVDAGWAAPGFWQSKEPSLALVSSVPFGPGAGEYLAWLKYGGGEDFLNAAYEKHNIHSELCGILAPEAAGWFREEITSIDQFDGMKMRIFGLGGKVMQKLGVDTQLLGGGDVFPALERGTIDAAEFSMPAIDLKLGFYQVAKHYYFPGWHQQSTMVDFIINKDKWDAMSEAQQGLIKLACEANITVGLAEGESIQGAALAELESKGAIVHTWSPEILATFKSTWEEVVAEEAAADPAFNDAWNSLTKFRAEYEPWKAVGYLK
ncbi:MAG: TRAP-type mannitol/chloroaromatic compound transport system substrate-binding protein [Celeribacter sp.]|jgi:TRAP-type mannitol/chloroaromatic compound transport system substrate-binding protein